MLRTFNRSDQQRGDESTSRNKSISKSNSISIQEVRFNIVKGLPCVSRPEKSGSEYGNPGDTAAMDKKHNILSKSAKHSKKTKNL